jgi:hypothetical protein
LGNLMVPQLLFIAIVDGENEGCSAAISCLRCKLVAVDKT